MIGAYEDSPYRCPRDGKRLVMDIGQDSDTGWVHEHHHWCISCDYQVRERPKAAKSITVAEILARRTAHLDTAAVRVGLGLESSDA